MRILIQDPVNNFFFTGRGWDDDETRAAEFENVARAEELCRKRQLLGALIVVRFKDGLDDVCYPAEPRNSIQLAAPRR